jgi:hypothetical protein
MGLLDDLKKQAENRLQQVPSVRENELEKHAYSQPVNSALKEASSYFSELAQSLNVVKPDVRRQYYLEGSAKLANLLQCDYLTRDRRKTVGGNDYLLDVSLHYFCVGNESLTFEKETRQANMIKEYLWAYSLPFQDRDVRDSNGRIVRSIITVMGKVPSSVTLTGDWDTGDFELKLRNVEVLGDVKQAFDTADINRDFFEEIGKVVLGQPNQLRSFGRHSKDPLPASFSPR